MRWILILTLLILAQKMIIQGKRSHSPKTSKKQQNQHTNISRLLDKLLENYVKLHDFLQWTQTLSSSELLGFVCLVSFVNRVESTSFPSRFKLTWSLSFTDADHQRDFIPCSFPSQDNSLRPNFGRHAAVVEIDLMVRSMGPVSEIEMVRLRRHCMVASPQFGHAG